MARELTPKDINFLKTLKAQGVEASEAYTRLDKVKQKKEVEAIQLGTGEAGAGATVPMPTAEEVGDAPKPPERTPFMQRAGEAGLEELETQTREAQEIREQIQSGEKFPPIGYLQLLGKAARVGTSPIVGAATALDPVTEALVEQVGQQTSEETKAQLTEGVKFITENFQAFNEKLPPELQDTFSGIADTVIGLTRIAELAPIGIGTKGAVKGAEEVVGVAGDIGKGAIKAGEEITETVGDIKRRADDFIQTREIKQVDKQIQKIKTDVDTFLDSKRAFSVAEKSPQFKNTDVRGILSDPEVFGGLRVVDGKLDPEDALITLQQRANQAMDAKRAILPIADERLPKVAKNEIREEALKNLPKLSPKGEADLIRKLDAELDALPDEVSISELDDLRARFRGSAVDAKGVQKPDSHFTTLENATRDLVFSKVDELPGAEGSFAGLNKYIKDTINTINFVDKKLTGYIVKSGKMTKLLTQTTGSVVGAPGGVLGSLGGAFAGGVVADILSNRALGNTIKREMLIKLSGGTPKEIQLIDDLIKGLPEVQALPSPTSEFRTQEKGLETIELPGETATAKGIREEALQIQPEKSKFKKTQERIEGKTTEKGEGVIELEIPKGEGVIEGKQRRGRPLKVPQAEETPKSALTTKKKTDTMSQVNKKTMTNLSEEAKKYKSAEEFVEGDKFLGSNGKEMTFLETINTPKGKRIAITDNIDKGFAELVTEDEFIKMVSKERQSKLESGLKKQDTFVKESQAKEALEKNFHGFTDNKTPMLQGRIKKNLNTGDLTKSDIERMVAKGDNEIRIINGRKVLVTPVKGGKFLKQRANKTQIEYFEYLKKRKSK